MQLQYTGVPAKSFTPTGDLAKDSRTITFYLS